jgi:hypothetical protein
MLKLDVYSLIPTTNDTLFAEEVHWNGEAYVATFHEFKADQVYAALQNDGYMDPAMKLTYHAPSELDEMCRSTYHPYGEQ